MPEKIELSVVVPCFNEAENLAALVSRTQAALAELPIAWELILVDDGSGDRTREKILAAEKADSRVRGAFHQENLGIVAGWNTGLEKSRGDFVITIDADLQYRPEDVPRLWQVMAETRADLVQGWRTPTAADDPARQRGSQLFSRLLNFLFAMKLKDNKSGFILYRREALAEVMAERQGFRLFQHFIAVAAHARGLRIVEVPVAFDPRRAGTSFIRNVFLFALRAFLDFPRAVWKFRVRPPA